MKRICGLDEAGRGPLAGPIVAAAVVAPEGFGIDAVDSKKLSEKRREAWAEKFKAKAEQDGIVYQFCIIEVNEINENGIGWANREVFRRLILALEADEYIVDGNHKLTDLGAKESRTQSIVRADQTIPLVSAASILAKTHRDQLMRELHEQHPDYEWNKNKGYGTRQHIQVIKRLGETPFHRRIFAQTVKHKQYASPLAIFLAKWFQNLLLIF